MRRVRGSRVGLLPLALWACLLQPALNAPGATGRRDWSHGRTRQVALFASVFVGGTDGWSLEGADPGSAPGRDVGLLQAQDHSLFATDMGPSVWYLTTPMEWGGERSGAYNGEVFFKLWHPEQPPGGTPAAASIKTPKTADVILETTCGFSVRLHDFLPAPRVISAVYNLPLSEEAAAWIDSRTNRRISRLDFLAALTHLRAIKIRGSGLFGAETVRLAEVRIVPPEAGMLTRADLEPCCDTRGRVAVCQRSGPPDRTLASHPEGLTPPGLKFECGGSLVDPAQRPRVRFVYPRSSRRSGGALITVLGENFGLNGRSFMRIAGKPSASCFIPKAQHCVNNVLDYDEGGVDCGGQNCEPCKFLVPHCSNGVMDLDEDKMDCGGKDCPRCTMMTFPEHCSNGIRDYDEAGIDKGGADCMPTFCFDWRIAGDKRDREKNCGGSCQPCFPVEYAPPDVITDSQVAVCHAPGNVIQPAGRLGDLRDAQVSFTSVDTHTGIEKSNCHNDDTEARGFAFDGYDFTWSLHMASLDVRSESDVNVTAIAVDQQTGDSYVTASVTRKMTRGDGKVGVIGRHLKNRGLHDPGAESGEDACENNFFTFEQCRSVGCCRWDPGDGSEGSGQCMSAVGAGVCHRMGNEHDFAMPNDAGGNALSDEIIHTVLLKTNQHGIPQWITYMESQYRMVADDILVDTTARPTRIIIAGVFKGYYPRFYNVNAQTKRARRGTRERGGGVQCSDMSQVEDPGNCWYYQGDPNYLTPFESGSIELAKPGIFLVQYNSDGLATAFKGGMYFKSVGVSFPIEGTVRIAAHTTFQRLVPKNASESKEDTPSAYVDDFNGLYLCAKLLVSRYKDIVYFGEQTPGYSRAGKNYGCKKGRSSNGTETCTGGTFMQKDVVSFEFPEILQTPPDDPSYVFLAKLAPGSRTFGTVWVRMIGEVGTNKRSNVAGLEADEHGVYITGAFTAGASTNLSYQSCEFGARLPECEPGGKFYRRATGLCELQDVYAEAPNQLCCKQNSTLLLERHIVRTHDFRRYSDTRRQAMFLASYNHKGVLRWHREAYGGNISVSAMALSSKKDVKYDIPGRSKDRRNPRLGRRGNFLYIAGNVYRLGLNVLDENGKIGNVAELTNFGQMKYPLSCSRNTTLVLDSTGNRTLDLPVVGDQSNRMPTETACSGRITSMGEGSDIYLVQFSADTGEPQWLKRFGQPDAWDYVTDIALDRRYSTIYMTGSFMAKGKGLQDWFGMELAGRHNLFGCNRWSSLQWDGAARRFDYQHLEGSNASLPSCKVSPLSGPEGELEPYALSGFVMEIAEGDPEQIGEQPWEQSARLQAQARDELQKAMIAETGGTGQEVPIFVPAQVPARSASSGLDGSSLPYSQCLDAHERACNADGILWVRTLHDKEFRSYATFPPQNPGRKVASGPYGPAHDPYVLVGGLFEGITPDNTGEWHGLQTQGFDEEGFFNQADDTVETYLMALAP